MAALLTLILWLSTAQPQPPSRVQAGVVGSEVRPQETRQQALDGTRGERRKPRRKDQPAEAAAFHALQRRSPLTGDVPIQKTLAAAAQAERMAGGPLGPAAMVRLRPASGAFTNQGLIPYSATLQTLPRADGPAPGNLLPQSATPATLVQTWTSLGPGNIGGRTRGLVVQSESVLYAAGVAGGIWKTTNGGASWAYLDDFMANLAVSCLTQDPGNSSVLYAGTGEGYFNFDAVRGAGIFKTTDGGASWSQQAATTGADFYYVNQIRVSPNDSQRVYAATRAGLFKSSDGGASWTNKKSATTSLGFLELELWDNGGTDNLFAWQGFDTIYRSEDNGENWASSGSGIPSGQTRGSIGISTGGSKIYVAVAGSAGQLEANSLTGVYRTTDSGANWILMSDFAGTHQGRLNKLLFSNPVLGADLDGNAITDCTSKTIDANFKYSNQGWYDNVIAVDPTNADRVWVGGIDLWRSDDGGANWGIASYWWSSLFAPENYAHADQHAIAFSPDYNGSTNQVMYVGNDGGVFKTSTAAAVVATAGYNSSAICGYSPLPLVTWTNLNNNYGVTQYYHGAVSSTGQVYIGGCQDNGTLKFDSSSPNRDWGEILGGDGGYVAIDPDDSSVMYAEFQEFAFQKSSNGGMNFTSAVSGISASDGANFLFITPFAMDPASSSRLWIGGKQPWRTTNSAASWENANNNADLVTSGSISAWGIAPGGSGEVVYVGSSGGNLFVTTNALDATPTWTDIRKSPLPSPGSTYVSWIAVHPTDPDTAYVTYSNFDLSAQIFKTTDGGSSWTAVQGSGSTAIPNVPVHTVAIPASNGDMLFAGTDVGVFASADGGSSWSNVTSPGLARTVVEALVIQESTSQLLAFTHGRGVFQATIDAKGPAVALTYSKSVAAVSEGVLRITASFDEPIVTSPLIAIDRPGTGNDVSATSMTATVDSRIWTFDYTVVIASGDAPADGLTTVSITGAEDPSGNGNRAATNAAFTVDTKAPSGGLTFSKPSTVVGAGALTLTATFSEPIGTTPTLTIDRPGTGNDVTMASMTATSLASVWTFGYTVLAGNGDTILDGVATATVQNVFDSAGHAASPVVTGAFTIDTQSPSVVLSYSKTASAVSGGVLVVTATFSEPIVSTPAISIDRPGTGNDVTQEAMTATAVSSLWTFDYTVIPANGSAPRDGLALLSITGGLDAEGNVNSVATNASITIDTIAPAVILTYSESVAAVGAGALAITATFDETIVSVPRIAVDRPGSGNDISATSMTVTADSKVWTYSYAVAAQDGGTILDGAATVSITGATDAAGNLNAPASNGVLTIDTLAPTLAIGFDKPSAAVGSGPLVITASFTEPLGTAPMISVDRPGTGNDVTGSAMTASGGPAEWTFTYSALQQNGTTILDGSAGVTVAGGADAAGNVQSPASASFIVDTIAPTVTLSYSRVASAVGTGPLAVTATFSEPLVVTPSLAIDRPGTGNDLSGTPMAPSADPQIWTLAHTFAAQNGTTIFDGATAVTVSGGQDAAGNSNQVAAGGALFVDTTRPTVALTYSDDVAAVATGPLVLTATFNEAIASVPQIAVDRPGSGNDVAATSMTATADPKVWTFTYDVALENGITVLDGVTAVAITGAADAAGNTNREAANAVFTVESIQLTVALTYDRDPSAVGPGTLGLTATFSEALVTTPEVAVDRPGTGNDLAAASMQAALDARVWTGSYTVAGQNGTTILDGTASVTVSNGKTVSGKSNRPATNRTVVIDTTGPAVQLGYSKNRTAVGSGTLQITATFAEELAVEPAISIDRPGTGNDAAATTMAGTADPTLWTFDHGVAPHNAATVLDGVSIVTISRGRDAAGNENRPATNNTFVVDTTGPRPSLAISRGGTIIASGPLAITATYDEGLEAAPSILVDRPGTDNDVAATPMSPSSTAGVWTFVYTLLQQNGGGVLDGTLSITVTAGADRAGNAAGTAEASRIADTIAPTAVLRRTPSSFASAAGPVVYTATFDEPLASAPSIRIDRPGAANDVLATPMAATTDASVWGFTYILQVEDGATVFDGLVSASVAGGRDVAGNMSIPATDRLVADTVGPVAALSFSRAPSAVGTGVLTLTATFDEPVASTPSVSVDRPGGASDVGPVSMSATGSSSVWTAQYTVLPADGGSVLDGLARVVVTNAVDPLGNRHPIAAEGSFFVDTAGPAVELSYSQPAARVRPGSLTIAAHFDELPVGTPRISIDRAGTDGDVADEAMSATADPRRWTFGYTVLRRDDDQGGTLADGVAEVRVGGVRDAAGNESQPATHASFVIDSKGPTVTLDYDRNPAGPFPGPLHITATFSDPLSTAPEISIDRPGTGNDVDHAPMTGGADRTVWTYAYILQQKFEGGPDDGLATVLVTGGRDATGVENQPATNSELLVDSTGPEAILSYDADPNHVRAGALVITVAFGEPIVTTPVLGVDRPGTGNDASGPMVPSTNRRVWSFRYDVLQRSGDIIADGLTWVMLREARDRAGNASLRPVFDNFTIDTGGANLLFASWRHSGPAFQGTDIHADVTIRNGGEFSARISNASLRSSSLEPSPATTVALPRLIRPGEALTFPFQFTLPLTVPTGPLSVLVDLEAVDLRDGRDLRTKLRLSPSLEVAPAPMSELVLGRGPNLVSLPYSPFTSDRHSYDLDNLAADTGATAVAFWQSKGPQGGGAFRVWLPATGTAPIVEPAVAYICLCPGPARTVRLPGLPWPPVFSRPLRRPIALLGYPGAAAAKETAQTLLDRSSAPFWVRTRVSDTGISRFELYLPMLTPAFPLRQGDGYLLSTPVDRDFLFPASR